MRSVHEECVLSPQELTQNSVTPGNMRLGLAHRPNAPSQDGE
jgi:hypothetical protein